ncbi:hypothetical protein N0V93_003287 [Gnomoniopsis smithogilvyi]|uniref:Uncharacterized protein n=1 Tax=Gnomoniopsis smithogilvyi TaxID=1191159 RepID=A0A9W8Z0F7_9PEZI|nr:hypothetical protein N0V93_003287 [Gnomoniopsis smithogilvyi]
MGGWSGTWNSWFGEKSDDPLGKLDPNVRKFLEKESPVKFNKAQEGAAAAAKQQQQVEAQAQAEAAAKAVKDDPNAVPPQSLYQDGRYAHLWKTYRPQAEIENETKTDQEKLHDVLDAFKSRKNAIGAAAMENCAEEQMDWSNCMRSGTLKARMFMCRDEVRKFEKCYNMQTRLLKALGYLNALDRSPETDERIQLHADKLYHQMIEQEEAIAQAQKEGKTVPKFEPVIPREVTDAATEAALMSESAKKRVAEKLDGMSEQERAAEQAAVDAEMRAKAEMVGRIQGLWKEQEAERKARIEKGEASMWDKMATAFGSTNSSSNEKNK